MSDHHRLRDYAYQTPAAGKEPAPDKIQLTEAQCRVLECLVAGKTCVVPPGTRRWLLRQGFIASKPVHHRKSLSDVTITELGRKVLAVAERVIRQ